jgi:hypothetical protein
VGETRADKVLDMRYDVCYAMNRQEGTKDAEGYSFRRAKPDIVEW